MRRRFVRTSMALLLLLAGTALAQTPEKMGPKEKRLGESLRGAWNDRAAAIEGQLREGDCKRAERGADSLLRDIAKVLSGGGGAGPILAGPLRLRALAEACQGKDRLALWDLDSAQLLAPAIFVPAARLYGEAGTRLAEIRANRQPKTPIRFAAPEGSPLGPLPKSFTPPDSRTLPEPIYHPGLDYPASLSKTMKSGTFALDLIIDSDGFLVGPRLTDEAPLNAVFLFSALDGIRHWRYKPVQLDGKPIDSDYRLTIIYELR